jgi:suppressor for copper-sensitivity B
MTSRRRFSFFLLLPLALSGAVGAQSDEFDPHKAKLVLEADRTSYAPGSQAGLIAAITIENDWHVNSDKPTLEYLIPTKLALTLPDGWAPAAITYPAAKMKKFSFQEEPLSVFDGSANAKVRLVVPANSTASHAAVKAVLSYQSCNDRQCLPPTTAEAMLDLPLGADGEPTVAAALFAPPSTPSTRATAKPPISTRGLLGVLALAFLGGLILNAMPCVLPILSLKIFGLVQSASGGRREIARGMLATAAGMLVSFWALGAAAIAARSAGNAVGWGVQFQQPGFVAFLAAIVVLFSLNLWGVFEIPLPGRLARIGGGQGREGTAGHFVSGLFATLMATPCSAPFLGSALGFALAQNAGTILATFTAVGLGMALPYLLVAAFPSVARFLPRPGVWMETLKGTMGFLLAAAAVWLFFVLSSQVSAQTLALVQLALLGLALIAWLGSRGRFGQLRPVAGALLIVAIAGTVWLAGSSAGSATVHTGEPAQKLIAWVPFDRAQAESLAQGGQAVFVDVTADWCFTCKVNERLVLETAEVAGAFKEHNVIAMKADWTNQNDEIGAFLAEHGRYGIPFYVLYRPGAEPHVFSELLTQEAVLAAVRAARG